MATASVAHHDAAVDDHQPTLPWFYQLTCFAPSLKICCCLCCMDNQAIKLIYIMPGRKSGQQHQKVGKHTLTAARISI